MSRAAAEQDVFRAVADASRRVILDALAERPHSFRELHALLPLTKGAVSQHLAILVAVGLVSVTIVDRQTRVRARAGTPSGTRRLARRVSALLDGPSGRARRGDASAPGGQAAAPATCRA